MTISREMREFLFSVIAPVPYLIILLIVLQIPAAANPAPFLFVYTLVVSFFYLMLIRTVTFTRSNLSERKENAPSPNTKYEGTTYSERFLNISYEALFSHDSDVEPISEYSNRPLFRFAVYSFWGFVFSIGAFLISGSLLGRLVTLGALDSIANISVSNEAFQNAPLGMVNFLLAIVPIFEGLDFENQVFIGGVMFLTGFFFLTAARNLSEISDDVHKRILRLMVAWNPLTKNELFHALLITGFYVIVLFLT
ncbi:hypothetical protein [Halorubrum sp. DTA98]|uniref:hypothetical protein n=1 Tax=Halorubrum sp. DTA98 TaxID=3402163 RepID=UPI003AAE1DF1